MLNAFFDQMAEDMFFAVAPQVQPLKPNRLWRETRLFELGRDHTDRVHEVAFLSYLNTFELEQALVTGGPPAALALLAERMPDFDPIPPGTRLYE